MPLFRTAALALTFASAVFLTMATPVPQNVNTHEPEARSLFRAPILFLKSGNDFAEEVLENVAAHWPQVFS